SGASGYSFGFASANDPFIQNVNPIPIVGYPKPSDYEIQFSSTIVDTSSLWPPPPKTPSRYFNRRIPVNFRIFNVTDSSYIKFALLPGSASPNSLSYDADMVFLDNNPRGGYSPSWEIVINAAGVTDTVIYDFTTGDKLTLKTFKSFDVSDNFEFSTVLPHVNNQTAASSLDNIRVVPNPYVTASSFEPPLPSGITSGRGERKMDFIHLPAQSKITIYTVRGDRIATLYHDSSISDGAVSWNLKTDENLDIAFGVYFYVVESPVGNKTGKIAIIK
ncbi:MAG TPA: hypothetical protein VKI62_03285, partial [Bacteroidota bacterium]|nr:hypothetical protein [Bacteroidota bacterium]